MISLSPDATAYLEELLSTDAIQGDPVVRIIRKRGAWSVRLDQVRAGDEVVEHSGQPLVAYQVELAGALEDKILEVRETREGPHLVLTLPGEKDEPED